MGNSAPASISNARQINPFGKGWRLSPGSAVCDRSPVIVLSTGVSSVAHSVALQKNPSRDCTLVSPRCRTAERPWGSGPTTNRLAGVVMAVLPFISLLLLGFSGACGGKLRGTAAAALLHGHAPD